MCTYSVYLDTYIYIYIHICVYIYIYDEEGRLGEVFEIRRAVGSRKPSILREIFGLQMHSSGC